MSATNETDLAHNPDAPETAGVVGEYYDSYPPLNVEQPIVICLDSNVFRKHLFAMKLWDDLEALKSSFSSLSVIVPAVVLRETHRIFATEMEKRCTSKHDFIPPDIRERCNEVRDDASSQIKKAFEDYWAKWRQRLSDVAEIVELGERESKRAIERALDRRPPCRNGEEIRDGVIWETILTKCQNNDTTALFVSENTNDYPFQTDDALRVESETNRIRWFRVWHHAAIWLSRVIPPERAETARTTPESHEPEAIKAAYLNRPPRLPDDEVISQVHEALNGYWCYEGDLEIVDASRVTCDIGLVDARPDGTTSFEVEEQWFVEFSFSLFAQHNVGGSDGIDVPVHGDATATATITLTRIYKLNANGSEESETLESLRIEDLDYDENWDPREAWIDSLDEGYNDYIGDQFDAQDHEAFPE